ncbi:glycosyltransferase family 2 protein [Roseibaca sp. Y0-43]|uniref:glycosyltransferase family 2 protein n=1 Tax=Roseibaca sp. Y0-43 TaxID=2816854 RepID=UPI001D0C1279|nr:glycosyltransferase family 2 protein [Roseibaca sp. Y0-43]
MNRVTIVTVAYNSAKVLPGMLGSLPEGVPAIIVDNASTDTGMLRGLVRPNVSLLEQPENTGFGRACNAGAAQAKTEFLLFLNPDARLVPDTLAQLVAAADRYPDAVGFNPRFTDDAGVPAFKRTCHLLPRSDWMPRGQPAADCDLPVLSGAAIFVRRADFEAVGGFDPNIFLFFEDDDLSLRLRKRGRLMFIRDALVQHTGGGASVPNPRVEWLKAWHFGYSRIYASRKHGRRFAFAKTLVRAIPRALSPRVLFSAAHRAESWGYLGGIVYARLGRPNPGDRI